MVISMISQTSSGSFDGGWAARGAPWPASKTVRALASISRLRLVTGANRPRSTSTRFRRIDSDASNGVPWTSKSRAGV